MQKQSAPVVFFLVAMGRRRVCKPDGQFNDRKRSYVRNLVTGNIRRPSAHLLDKYDLREMAEQLGLTPIDRRWVPERITLAQWSKSSTSSSPAEDTRGSPGAP